MSKYRIITHMNKYYPQRKHWLWGWQNFPWYDEDKNFSELFLAEEFIEEKLKEDALMDRGPIIVWEDGKRVN